MNIKISAKHEGTSYPYWIIIDPRQNFKTNENGIYNIARMITGIWFSRESAEEFLKKTRYNFSENAKVFCHSGNYSEDYVNFYNENNELL